MYPGQRRLHVLTPLSLVSVWLPFRFFRLFVHLLHRVPVGRIRRAVFLSLTSSPEFCLENRFLCPKLQWLRFSASFGARTGSDHQYPLPLDELSNRKILQIG